MALINVENLVKEYTCTKRQPGFGHALRSLIKPCRETLRAVDAISFAVEPGEMIGFIGPNGAGKSTTVKMMSGILHPTSGRIEIMGRSPQKDRIQVCRQLGVVFGQRSQLYWDLRLGESFELLRRMYQVSSVDFNAMIKRLDQVLAIGEILQTPVRQLSLGQRMRGDLAAAMLHNPPILFLDEPTIGLDLVAKQNVREFILEINRQAGTTVILTTHDLDDVEQLCDRLIVINHGKIIADGQLQNLVEQIAPDRYLVVEMAGLPERLSHPSATVVNRENNRAWFRFSRNEIDAASLIVDLMRDYPIKDFHLEEPHIEELISRLYQQAI